MHDAYKIYVKFAIYFTDPHDKKEIRQKPYFFYGFVFLYTQYSIF